jgi:antitoxin component YwqK of YwqJK toxin-antitoxin module
MKRNNQHDLLFSGMRHTLILFLFVATAAYSQVNVKLNYNKYWELTIPDSAVYVRMAIYDTTNLAFAGPVTDMYRSGKPQMKGTYALQKKEGEFVLYYENGNVEEPVCS